MGRYYPLKIKRREEDWAGRAQTMMKIGQNLDQPNEELWSKDYSLEESHNGQK